MISIRSVFKVSTKVRKCVCEYTKLESSAYRNVDDFLIHKGISLIYSMKNSEAKIPP